MKVIKLLPLILSAVVALTSCKKELDFEYHDIPALPVIEGCLTPDGVRVSLTATTPMGEAMDRTRYTNAQMSLLDLTSGESVTLLPDAENYFTAPIEGVPGHDYQLSVSRDGRQYSAVATMYDAPTWLSLEFNWISMPYDDVAVLQGKFLEDPAVPDECFWIRIYRNGEIYLWAAMDDRSSDNGVLTFSIMTSRRDVDEEDDDEVLYDGDTVSCTLCRISRAMLEYLDALGNDSNGPVMFTEDMALGYFMATTPTSLSIDFHPDLIPNYND